MALERLPLDPERRWRIYQLIATASAGSIVSVATAGLGGFQAGVLGSVLTQTNYGFAFTAYDPYSADPLVFVFVALIAWCWFDDRWRLAALAGLVGIFAKETVALVSASCAFAALAGHRNTRR